MGLLTLDWVFVVTDVSEVRGGGVPRLDRNDVWTKNENVNMCCISVNSAYMESKGRLYVRIVCLTYALK